MHILLIHQAFTTLDEAGGTRHAELAQYMANEGHQVSVISSSISYLTGKPLSRQAWVIRSHPLPQLTIYRCYTYNALHKSYFFRLLSYFSFMASSFITAMCIKSVDAVWGTSPPIFQGANAWLVARLKKVPWLFEVRDLWPAFAIAVGVLKNPLLIKASEWLERFLYCHADRMIVNSPGFIDHVTQHGAQQMTLIPNGVDVTMFNIPVRPVTFRNKHGWQDHFVVLYTGAHGLSNDLEVVLEAAHLLKSNSMIRFVLVGDGMDKPKLIKYASQTRLNNVEFLPPQPKRSIPELLGAADACLAILKPLEMYKTTYPNKVFDYMAAGKPIILAIDGVIRQVVEDAKCGIFVTPGDPQKLADVVNEMAGDPERCKTMGRSGYHYVREHFDRVEGARKLLDMFIKMKNRK